MRIGLVGYGFGGRTFHAPLITVERRARARRRRHDERGAHRLARRRPARGARRVGRLGRAGDARRRGGRDQLGDGLALELADEAIGLGLHVVVDKPLAVDATHAAADRGRGAGRGRGAERLPEPPVGLRLPHREAPARRRRARRRAPLRVARRALVAGGRPLDLEGRRHRPSRAAGCASTCSPTSSTRPCSSSATSPRCTPRSTCAAPAAPPTTTRRVSLLHTSRRALAAGREQGHRRHQPAYPRDGLGGRLRRRRVRRPGGRAARRSHPRHRGRRVGRRGGVGVGRDPPRRRDRGRAERARPVGHLLPRVRRAPSAARARCPSTRWRRWPSSRSSTQRWSARARPASSRSA